MTTIPGGFPAEKRIQNGVQLRVTESGVQFIEDNVDQILGDMLPDGLIFTVPPTCDQSIVVGTIDLCGQGDANNCVADDPPCQVQLELLGLTISPTAPSTVDVEARINVWSLDTMHTYGGLGALDCNIDLDTRNGSQAHATAVASLSFSQDGTSNRTRMELAGIDIPEGEIEGDDLVISGGVSCWAIDTFFKGTIIDQIRDQLRAQVEPMMRNVCMTCDTVDPHCPQMSACEEVDVDGDLYQWCMEESGAGCVQLMGHEGRLSLGVLMASIAPDLESTLDIHAWAGGYTTAVNQGVSQGMLSGTVGLPSNASCVPQHDPPAIQPAPISTVFEQNTRPDGEPYQIGLGIHESVLDSAGYALYDTGSLCMDIGPRQSDFLTVGTFAVLLDSLNDLMHDTDPALVLAVRPQNPLTFELGSGTSDATGEIEEPLITVRSADMAIDFYGLIDYRFIRLFRLVADLALPLNLDVNQQNQLVPVIGDLAQGFENVRVEHSELLSEDPEEIAAVFPMLLDLAAGMIGQDTIPPIDLPNLQGFRLVLGEGSITSVDENTFLAIFADLEYTGTSPSPTPLTARAETSIWLEELHIPPGDRLRASSVAQALEGGPRVVVGLSGKLPERGHQGEALEWSYRLDSGLWSTYRRGERLEIQRPILWLQGRHLLEVRSRVANRPETTDPTPAQLEILIDTVPPELSYRASKGGVVLLGRDAVTPADRLEYGFRTPSGEWSGWSTSKLVPADVWRAAGKRALEVRVRDEAGNSRNELVALYGRVQPTGEGCSCTAASTGDFGAPVGWLIIVGLCAAGLFARNRRRKKISTAGRRRHGQAWIVAAAGALLAAGLCVGCGGKSSGNKECTDATDIPLVCADPVPECEHYEEIVGTEPMTIDPKSCEPVPVECECFAEEVDPGDYGRFLSVAAGGGRVLVACYSDRWGDLNVVEVGVSGELTPEAVDGAPFGTPPGGDPEGFRQGITRRGENVGKFTSISIGGDSAARISYVDVDEGALKYAQGQPGEWSIHYIVDPEAKPADEKVWYTELLLDGGDVPHVLFMVNGVVDASDVGSFYSELRMGVASSSNPRGPEDWDISVVDRTMIPCAGYCESSEICLAEGWTCVTEDDGCGECPDGQGCFSNMCLDIVEEPSWTDHPEGVGLYLSAGWLSDGRLAAAYHDRSGGLAKLAVRDGSTWLVQTLEGDAHSDVGLYSSLAVGADDALHITYHDAVDDALIYRRVEPDLTPSVREIVDDGLREDGQHVVGLDSEIFLDDSETVRVFYQDGTTADLLEASRAGADDWMVAPAVEGDGGYGFFVDLARAEDGTRWIVHYTYDRAAEMFGSLAAYTLEQ
jgi:hypothetical protein